MILPDKKDLIVTLADANFINQAKQLFSSVYFKAGWQGDYLLLASNISEADLAWFREKGILIYECLLLSDVPVGSRSYPPVVLSKFYLFKEYFKQWRKVIFLDADIIVKAPLMHLLDLNGFNAPEATTLRLRNEFVNNLEPDFKKKYKLAGRAFNTGVLVFETDLINHNTFSEMIALYHQFQDIALFNEESILNLYFYQQWQMLPVVYNSVPWHMKEFYGLTEDKVLAFIIHFVCFTKPWNGQSFYYQEWLNNLKKAEEINLARRPEILAPFSDKELSNYLKYVKRTDFIFLISTPFLFVDRQIGNIGQLIARTNPKLYKVINLKRFFKSRPVDKDLL